MVSNCCTLHSVPAYLVWNLWRKKCLRVFPTNRQSDKQPYLSAFDLASAFKCPKQQIIESQRPVSDIVHVMGFTFLNYLLRGKLNKEIRLFILFTAVKNVQRPSSSRQCLQVKGSIQNCGLFNGCVSSVLLKVLTIINNIYSEIFGPSTSF
jgi:hypothetical protein